PPQTKSPRTPPRPHLTRRLRFARTIHITRRIHLRLWLKARSSTTVRVADGSQAESDEAYQQAARINLQRVRRPERVLTSRLDGISPGPLFLGFAIEPGVVPNADSIRAGRRQIRDLEIGARASHAAHKCDVLTEHVAGRVQGLCEETHVLCVLALVVIDVTGDS